MVKMQSVTGVELVGMARIWPEESRHRPFDPAEFLSGNEIAAGLRSADPDAERNLRARLELTVAELLSSGNPEDLEFASRFLCDFRVIAARVALEPDLRGLLADLERVADRLGPGRGYEVAMLKDALRRSSGTLRLARDQLSEQLLGRLSRQPGELLSRLTRRAAGYKSGCWLRPVTASLGGSQEVVGYLEGLGTAAHFEESGLLLTVDSTGWLQRWDLSASKPPVGFRIGDGEPTGLACSGGLAAIPTREGPIHLIELATGVRRPSLRPDGSRATLAVAFIGPDRLASGGTDGRIRLWDTGSGDSAGPDIDLDDLTVNVLLPLDGSRLVAGTDPEPETRCTVQIWDLSSGHRVAAFAEHDWPATALDLDAETGLLVAAANDELSVWHLPELSCIQRIRPERETSRTTFHAVVLSSGERLTAADAHGALRVFDVADGLEVGRAYPHGGLVPSIAADRPRRRFVTVSWDQSVRRWDAAALEPTGQAGHQQAVTAFSLTANGDWLISGATDGRLLVRDARTGAVTAELGHHDHWVSGVNALPGDFVVSAGWDGMIRIWDLGTRQCLTVIATGDKHVTKLACSPDGTAAATVSTEGVVRVWDLGSGVQQAVVTSSDRSVVAIAVDAEVARWVSEAGHLYTWPMRGEPNRTEVTDAEHVTACDFGQRDGACVLGLARGQFLVVDAAGDVQARFGDARSGPASIARGGRGRLLLAAHGLPHSAADQVARLWMRHPETGEFSGSADAVLVGDVPFTAVALAGDGRLAYLGDESGAVHVIEPVVPAVSRPTQSRGR